MDVKRWVDEARFSGEKFQKVNLFDSERMFCDIYCFEPGQEQALHSHADNDKIYHVIEGRGPQQPLQGVPPSALHAARQGG